MTLLADAQHEAAHVVVGVSLGLRLRKAVAGTSLYFGETLGGYVWFYDGHKTAESIMFSAGIAFEQARGTRQGKFFAEADLQYVREIERTPAGCKASLRAAQALLRDLAKPHDLVTRMLVEHRKITHRDIVTIITGEKHGD